MDGKGLILFGLIGAILLLPILLRRGLAYHLVPVKQPQPATYTNEEVWEVEWNEEGLPSKVVIHRRAVQT
ncbi:unnamed protein product [marine sediment metagenome]|uniref:Uncharacterized protein n=1 Tax=marine sediment metagenome TaxID=412755 RepID=X1UYI0_9ZZZZ